METKKTSHKGIIARDDMNASMQTTTGLANGPKGPAGVLSPWRTLAWPPALVSTGLCFVGFVGWLWYFSAGDSAHGAICLVGILTLAALAGLAWYASRARAYRRWRAALDRYAQKELTKRTNSRRLIHARPQSQAR